MKITRLIVLIQYLASVNCPSLFTGKLAWLSPPYVPPTAPAPLLTNPYNYVGHKGSDLAAGPKRGWVGWGVEGRDSTEISVVLVTAQISDKSKQLPPSPRQTPLPPRHNPHDLWQVITFMLEMQPDQERSVRWCGGEAACALGAIVEKELTAWMGSHLIGKNIGRSNWKSRGHRLRVRFVMMMCTDQMRVLIQLNVSF